MLTRHFVWRQSRWGMIRDTTRRLFLVAEILPPARAQAEGVLEDFRSLADFLGGRAATAVLDERDRSSVAPPWEKP